MEIQRADGFVVQTGNPDGDDDGFRDPKTKDIRRVPMEVAVVGDKEIVYNSSLEDLGRSNESVISLLKQFELTLTASNLLDGRFAVFFLLKQSELTPAGSNLLDGRFAVFGYVVEGEDALGYMGVGDKIEYIKVLDGKENLVRA
eukprot:gene7946-1161_t